MFMHVRFYSILILLVETESALFFVCIESELYHFEEEVRDGKLGDGGHMVSHRGLLAHHQSSCRLLFN